MAISWNVFVTHPEELFALNIDIEVLRALEEVGNVRRNLSGHYLAASDLALQAAGCQVILTDGKADLSAAVIGKLSDLLAVIRNGVEVRNIDVEAATEAGVVVLNTRGEYIAPVVELTLGFMLCLARDIVNRAHGLRARQHIWSQMGSQLRGHVLGIVGFGDIGRELARAAGALGMRVCFTDPYVNRQQDIEKLDLKELLAVSDFVSVHAKWTPETEGMFNETTFRSMKPTAYFINTSRGALVDERALERALREAWIAGAALDVFNDETEIVGNRLIDLPNVIATPHIGGFSPEVRRAETQRCVDMIHDLMAGRIPKGVLNVESIQRPRVLNRVGFH